MRGQRPRAEQDGPDTCPRETDKQPDTLVHVVTNVVRKIPVKVGNMLDKRIQQKNLL